MLLYHASLNSQQDDKGILQSVLIQASTKTCSNEGEFNVFPETKYWVCPNEIVTHESSQSYGAEWFYLR